MQNYTGGCHCGNIRLEMRFEAPTHSFHPRACDCDFCSKHGAAYVSDDQGKLSIHIKNEDDVSRYKQGSGLAEFMVCRCCGVLVGVSYEEQGKTYVAVNSKVIESPSEFGPPITTTPKQLPDEEKISRWKKLWFADVVIE